MTEPFEQLLDVEQAGELLRLHPKTIQRLCREGVLPCVRMGKYWRFRASSLDTYLKAQIECAHQSRRVSQ
jgi:excisionase family DNA binding protein